MPHYICRWPAGDVLLASVENRQELDSILQEKGESGACKVARYHGPLVLELKPKIPGMPQTRAARFKVDPPCGAFAAAWPHRARHGDVTLVAADGTTEPAHRVALQCRLPLLAAQPLGSSVQHMRVSAIPDHTTLLAWLEFVYTDGVPASSISHQLHLAALRCQMERLATICEAHFASRLEQQLGAWGGLSEGQRDMLLDALLDWARYSDKLERCALREFCLHAAARHLARAQERPAWQRLGAAATRLVEAIARCGEQPTVERQVEAGDHSRLCVVQLEAELYARAGGRMTDNEWRDLQLYRAAVSEAGATPDVACPWLVSEAQLRESSLASCELPHMPFEVAAPTLGPQRRLLNSVTQFAFPHLHGALARLRQERARPGGGGAAASLPVRAASPAGAAAARGTLEAGRAAAAGAAAPALDGMEAAQPTQAQLPTVLVGRAAGGGVAAQPAAAALGGGCSGSGELERASQAGLGREGSSSSIEETCAAGLQAQQLRGMGAAATATAAAAVPEAAQGGVGHWGSGNLRRTTTDSSTEAGSGVGGSTPPPQQAPALQQAGASAPAASAPPPVQPLAAATHQPHATVAAASAAQPAALAAPASPAAPRMPPSLEALRQAIVQDFVTYDDAWGMKVQLAAMVVAAEQGDAAAAERLLDGEVAPAAPPPAAAAASPAHGGHATYRAPAGTSSRPASPHLMQPAAGQEQQQQQQQQHNRPLALLRAALEGTLGQVLSGMGDAQEPGPRQQEWQPSPAGGAPALLDLARLVGGMAGEGGRRSPMPPGARNAAPRQTGVVMIGGEPHAASMGSGGGGFGGGSSQQRQQALQQLYSPRAGSEGRAAPSPGSLQFGAGTAGGMPPTSGTGSMYGYLPSTPGGAFQSLSLPEPLLLHSIGGALSAGAAAALAQRAPSPLGLQLPAPGGAFGSHAQLSPHGPTAFGSILAQISSEAGGGARGGGEQGWLSPPGAFSRLGGGGGPAGSASPGAGAGTLASPSGRMPPPFFRLHGEGGLGWAPHGGDGFGGGSPEEGGEAAAGAAALEECSIRRITCHGLMELCAALAGPQEQQKQQQLPAGGAGGGAAAGVGGAAVMAAAVAATGLAAAAQGAATATAAVAGGTEAGEAVPAVGAEVVVAASRGPVSSNRQSAAAGKQCSNNSSTQQQQQGTDAATVAPSAPAASPAMAGRKRRLSSLE